MQVTWIHPQIDNWLTGIGIRWSSPWFVRSGEKTVSQLVINSVLHYFPVTLQGVIYYYMSGEVCTGHNAMSAETVFYCKKIIFSKHDFTVYV